MTLPPAARERLSAPLRAAFATPTAIRKSHTMPVAKDAWDAHASALREVVLDFHTLCTRGAQLPASFHTIEDWVAALLRQRVLIHSLTLSLQPFEYFDHAQAELMLRNVDADLLLVAEGIDKSVWPSRMPGGSAADDSRWLAPTASKTTADTDAVGRAFQLDSQELYDIHGEFSPALVFADYYLNNSSLIELLIQHFRSLGLPSFEDPLVAVCVVGWISSARDQIAAYRAMDALVNRLARQVGTPMIQKALEYLRQREIIQRQNRYRIGIATQRMATTDDQQSFAFDLADVYKRLVEGPVKQYGWVLHCLTIGAWMKPLRLDNIRDALIADGEWTADLARSTMLTSIRNGEAHEDLHWDGFRGCYVVDGIDVARDDVARAAMRSDSFARGCDAAITYFEGIDVVPTRTAANPTDIGRVSAWRRAAAHFGSNGLRLRDANFNAATVEVYIEEISINDVDPCFQAIATCRGLLPLVERYEVYVAGSSEPVISVTAEALDRTLPIRDQALEWFTLMPRATFLPAHLDARSIVEDPSTAARSVAWFATTDLLDIVDDSPAVWPPSQVELAVKRLTLIGLSVTQCIAAAPVGSQTRLLAVHQAASEVGEWLRKRPGPILRKDAHRLEAVGRAQVWLTQWGPVEVLPSVDFAPTDDDGRRQNAILQDPNPNLTWRTI